MKSLSMKDLSASLVVFVVAIPLSLGISLASDVPIASGLIAAIIGGLIVGSLTGAPLVVSGPAAGLIALILEIQHSMGFSGLLWATTIAGLLQLILSALKFGRFFHFVSEGVLNGMLGAIGFTIIAGQLHVLMGATIPKGLWNSLVDLPLAFLNHWQNAALACGLLAILVHILWNRKPGLSGRIPAALPAVIVASMASLLFEVPRVELAAIGDFALAHLSQLTFGSLTQHWGWTLLYFSVGLAVVASAESLLTARAIAKLSEKGGSPFPVNLDRELMAQGVGNLVSGAMGGLPITGVIVRSAANVNAGAQTRASACLHGLWILLLVSFASTFLEKIPLTALAAILIMTGVKLLNLRENFRRLFSRQAEGLFWAVTFVSIILSNLLTGLAIGIVSQIAIDGLRRLQNERVRDGESKQLKSAA